jgi:hypothetical protein
MSNDPKIKGAASKYVAALTELQDVQSAQLPMEAQVLFPDTIWQFITDAWPTLHASALEKARNDVDAAFSELSVVISPPAPPKPVGPLVNPFCMAYDEDTNIEMYSQPGALIVCGRKEAVFHTAPIMQAARAAGAKLLQYIVPADWQLKLNNAFDRDYYGKFTDSRRLWPYATRSKWEGTTLSDMRPGSAWLDYTVAYMVKMYKEGRIDGWFLDTVGARTYAKTTKWEDWSLEEKDQYMLGNIELVARLHDLLPREAILINNSVWHREDTPKAAALGGQYVNGSCLEHHSATSKWHRDYAARTFGRSPRYMLAISNGEADAVAWSKVPGITHVSAQETYEEALVPPFPFNSPGVPIT